MSNEIKDKNDRDYTNGEITVFWRPAKCTHITTCFNELISVFDPSKRPWVNMKGAPTEEIIRVVDMCPTGAITWKRNKDIEAEKNAPNKEENNVEKDDKPFEGAEIKVMPDGPLIIKGNFRLTGPGGAQSKNMKMISLCRCGQSRNMPYCDGMHRKIGFRG